MARKFNYTKAVYDKKTDFPTTGDVDTIYIDASKNKAYRFDVDYYDIGSSDVAIWGALGDLSKKGGGASWGDITGALSNQTDLNSALSEKQETLVSGANIKTINGSSVIGSGDLVLGGGGGAPATQILIEPKSGSYYAIGLNGIVSSNITTISSGLLLLSAFTPGYDFQINAISFVQITTALAGGRLKVVIYSNRNAQPYQKLFESATVAVDTTGMKLLTGLSFTFNANETYWISVVSNGNVGLRAFDTFQVYAVLPVIANSSSTQFYQEYYYQSNFNSLPTIMPNFTSSNYANSRVPMITFRKS